jgi:hypothetical protein
MFAARSSSMVVLAARRALPAAAATARLCALARPDDGPAPSPAPPADTFAAGRPCAVCARPADSCDLCAGGFDVVASYTARDAAARSPALRVESEFVRGLGALR